MGGVSLIEKHLASRYESSVGKDTELPPKHTLNAAQMEGCKRVPLAKLVPTLAES